MTWQEFKSNLAWQQSVYRTRMGDSDGGELIVLAPGIDKFGEDPGIDKLIASTDMWAGKRC